MSGVWNGIAVPTVIFLWLLHMGYQASMNCHYGFSRGFLMFVPTADKAAVFQHMDGDSESLRWTGRTLLRLSILCGWMWIRPARKAVTKLFSWPVWLRGSGWYLLGTQMIAKGLIFPNVTLVYPHVDTALNPDFRSSATFQLLTCGGRTAGRAEKAGQVLIRHTILSTMLFVLLTRNRDYSCFTPMKWVLASTRLSTYYFSIIGITLSHKKEEEVVKRALWSRGDFCAQVYLKL